MGKEETDLNTNTIIINRNNCSQDELAILLDEYDGTIQILEGDLFKEIPKDEIYYIDPNKHTIKVNILNTIQSKRLSSINSDILYVNNRKTSSSGLIGYGLNLI